VTDDARILEEDDDVPGELRQVVLGPEAAGLRLDKAMAAALPELSRARLQALIAAGRLSRDGSPATSASARAVAGAYELVLPPPEPASPEPQDIALEVLFEDADLIVVDKRAGMAVHPAPGTPDRTLVNALLFHCREGLSGIGGVARPGIVHRLDKDTSGVMVAAKTDAAHQGLAAQFARHDIERQYLALVRGAPRPSRGIIETRIGRSPNDRKKMAVLRSGGREAVTLYETAKAYGPQDRPLAARVACRLRTGRTHQIRVHLASKGCPVLGDPLYGSGPPATAVRAAIETAGLRRQALHAAVLGFVHPVSGRRLQFERAPPEDMVKLEALLAAL
jgi:23S rRNA pseudouridine1911/1915/1917 synthase